MNKETSDEERKALHEALKAEYEYTFDLDNLKPVKHSFVDRGEVLSCEGAGHPNHRHFKVKR